MSVSHRGLEGLRRKEPCRVVREILKNRGTQFDFAVALRNTLPHFKGGKLSQFALPFKQKLGCAGNNLCAFFDRSAAQDTKALSAVAKASIIS